MGDAVVLCVGAGSICCELLKTLAASGVARIDVVSQCNREHKHGSPSLRAKTVQVDPDTVEPSSIGWQLVFREQHVGRSKAEVAAEALRDLRPLVDITAWHRDIRDGAFGVDFFRQFNLVVSTVENVEDKRHVNRLCLAANVPLISAGASENLGQVDVGPILLQFPAPKSLDHLTCPHDMTTNHVCDPRPTRGPHTLHSCSTLRRHSGFSVSRVSLRQLIAALGGRAVCHPQSPGRPNLRIHTVCCPRDDSTCHFDPHSPRCAVTVKLKGRTAPVASTPIHTASATACTSSLCSHKRGMQDGPQAQALRLHSDCCNTVKS
jgi:hypothetical protein